jgi:ParB family chromosome partitioning protein
MDGLGLTQEQVAQRVGLQRSTITNHLRLLELPEEVQDAVGQSLITMGHARALLGLPDADQQRTLMEETVRGDLSVRAVERKVKEARETVVPAAPSPAVAKPAPWAIELEGRLRDSLGTKVRVQPGLKERGQIVIEYFDRASLEGLITRLAPKATL